MHAYYKSQSKKVQERENFTSPPQTLLHNPHRYTHTHTHTYIHIHTYRVFSHQFDPLIHDYPHTTTKGRSRNAHKPTNLCKLKPSAS